MATRENAPPPPGWRPEPRPNPCDVRVAEPLSIPPNIVLSDN